MTEKQKRLVYTVDEVAKLLRISRGAAYEAAKNGELPAIRIGKRILIPKASLEKMLGSTVDDL